MNNKTAFEVAAAEREEIWRAREMHERHRRFCERWEPSRFAAEFHADLAMLMQAVHREAQAPFVKAAQAGFALARPAPIFMHIPEKPAP